MKTRKMYKKDSKKLLIRNKILTPKVSPYGFDYGFDVWV